MKKLLVAVSALVVSTLLACGGGTGGTGGGAGGGSGGGSAGGGGGGSGGGSGGGQGGGSGGGVADAGMPPIITVQFQTTCPPLTACGGNVVGTWHYSGGCVETGSLFPQAKAACAGLTVSNVSGTSKGAVTFNATQVNRAITNNFSGTVLVPPPCASPGCPAVQTAMLQYFKTATCTASGSDCSCAVTFEGGVAGTSPYTLGTNSLTTDPGTASATTYDYCVSGTNLTYRELGSSPTDPGIFVMGKK